MTRGYSVPEVGQAYNRAHALCQQLGDTSQLFPVLLGLFRFYVARPENQTARQLGEQLLRVAEQSHDAAALVMAHYALGHCLFQLGEQELARAHFEQGIARYDPEQHRSLTFRSGDDPGVSCHAMRSVVLWMLGYPDQVLTQGQEAISLAKELAHPSTQAFAILWRAFLSMFRREAAAAQEWAEQAMTLYREHGMAFFLDMVMITRGWALALQGRGEEGIAEIRQSLTALHAQGAEIGWTAWHGMLAQVYEAGGQREEGLTAVAEGLALVERIAERMWEAELYRLKGELTLQQEGKEQGAKSKEQESENPNPKSQILNPSPQGEAEACFHQAIAIARQRSTKSWELRATVSLARLWQQQGKRAEAHQMLAEIYSWFTEGFDTKDLQEAKALIEELSH